MQVKRDLSIDIIKGIGIILMVLVHAGGPFNHFINLFHMSIFFIMSGYLWNPGRVNSFKDVCSYIGKKARTLWVPFVVINIVLVILHNQLLDWGIYTNNPRIFEIAASSTNKVQNYLTIKGIAINITKVLLFAHTSQLAAPTWFLRTLFIVSVIYACISYLDKKIKVHWFFEVSAVALSGIMATILSYKHIVLPVGMSSVFPALYSYGLGVLLHRIMKKHSIIFDKGKYLYLQLLASAILLVCLNSFGSVALATGQITNILFYTIVSICGYYFLYSISVFINRTEYIKDVFSYIGTHSISVLVLHLVSFKLVSFCFILLTKRDIVYLALFPSIQGIPGLWVAYLSIGITVPLLLHGLWNKGKQVISSR